MSLEEEAYSQGHDCGFRDGVLADAQDGFARGYDEATKEVTKEVADC